MPSQSETIHTEIERFLADYRRDLLAHDAEAIAGRYHRDGVYFQGHGVKTLLPFEEVARGYREQWSGPATFEWQDISLEILAPDAVLVVGKMVYARAGDAADRVFAYTGLLLKVDGAWRIRLEHESRSCPETGAAGG